MGQNLKIQRVDLLKDGKSVKLVYAQSAVSKSTEVVDTDNVKTIYKEPHDDFKNCMLRMIPHLVYACELSKIESSRPEWFDDFKFLEDDRFQGFNVTGIVVSGKDQDIIKLIGTKTTSKKEVIPVLSPLIWLDDQSDKRYPLVDILKTNFSKTMNEANLYHNGKYAIEAQQELEFN